MEQSQSPPQSCNTQTPSKDAEASELDVSKCGTDITGDKWGRSPEREFSIRATNFDRGQLKLRIASKRVKKCNKDSVSSPDSISDGDKQAFEPSISDEIEQPGQDAAINPGGIASPQKVGLFIWNLLHVNLEGPTL